MSTYDRQVWLDSSAGKTIMAGLLIKELMVRGDLGRCLVVVPGGLAEQWQDELGEKFGLEFELLSREMVESSRSGNPLHLGCSSASGRERVDDLYVSDCLAVVEVLGQKAVAA